MHITGNISAVQQVFELKDGPTFHACALSVEPHPHHLHVISTLTSVDAGHPGVSLSEHMDR